MGFRPFASQHRFGGLNGFQTESSSKNPAGKTDLKTEFDFKRNCREKIPQEK